MRQQFPAIGVLEVLHRRHIDRHAHLHQVPDDPVGAGVHGLGDDQAAMALVELVGQLRSELLPEGRLQSARNPRVGVGDALYLVEFQVLDPGRILQGLRGDVPRGLAPLELDDHQIPLAIHAQQVDRTAEAGTDLPADDQEVGVEHRYVVGQPVLDPLFQAGVSRRYLRQLPIGRYLPQSHLLHRFSL